MSAPYTSLFTLFGQFFDHGLDLVDTSGGTVFVPLRADDPLVAGPDHVFGDDDDLPVNLRFMVLARATTPAGPDGVLGNADDMQATVCSRRGRTGWPGGNRTATGAPTGVPARTDVPSPPPSLSPRRVPAAPGR